MIDICFPMSYLILFKKLNCSEVQLNNHPSCRLRFGYLSTSVLNHQL
ncbi:hypothetical protein Plhal304r1_c060g0146271 [Plasmopara halstedii]